MRRWRQKFCGRWKQLCLITPINHAKVWRGKLDKNGMEWIYIKPRDALYRTMWWHTQQNNKLLGGQIYHTRYIVLLYQTCPCIVPYAAVSCLVLPNCHQCAAIMECKSSHKIVPFVAISPSVCYIVSGVPRYANNHATTSGMHYIVPYAVISYRMQWRLKV